MKVFHFPYHTPSIERPDSSTQVKFGKGYSAATIPDGPDQLVFVLDFAALFYWENHLGMFDAAIKPEMNALALEKFYEEHRMYKEFLYDHDIKGRVTVRFEKALPPLKTTPKLVVVDNVTNSRGHQTEPFQLRLVQSL